MFQVNKNREKKKNMQERSRGNETDKIPLHCLSFSSEVLSLSYYTKQSHSAWLSRPSTGFNNNTSFPVHKWGLPQAALLVQSLKGETFLLVIQAMMESSHFRCRAEVLVSLLSISQHHLHFIEAMCVSFCPQPLCLKSASCSFSW